MMDRMTRYALLVATAMVFVWSASAQIVEPRVAEVQISPADGPALVGLARGAMAEFLVNRTPVEKQTIPDSLAHLEHEQRTYAASVTLRHTLAGTMAPRSRPCEASNCPTGSHGRISTA